MKGDVMGQQQTYPDWGRLFLGQVGRTMREDWQILRGAGRPTYITVPVGRGVKAVLVVPPTAPAQRRR